MRNRTIEELIELLFLKDHALYLVWLAVEFCFCRHSLQFHLINDFLGCELMLCFGY